MMEDGAYGGLTIYLNFTCLVLSYLLLTELGAIEWMICEVPFSFKNFITLCGMLAEEL